MKCLDVVKEDMHEEVGAREDEVFGCGEDMHEVGAMQMSVWMW